MTDFIKSNKCSLNLINDRWNLREGKNLCSFFLMHTVLLLNISLFLLFEVFVLSHALDF